MVYIVAIVESDTTGLLQDKEIPEQKCKAFKPLCCCICKSKLTLGCILIKQEPYVINKFQHSVGRLP